MSKQAEIQRHERQAFAAPGSAFDRLIRYLRVGLPVGVGVIVALLAIAPVEGRNEFSFLLNRNEVEMAPEQLRMTRALYRGEDSQGQPFAVRARSAMQRSSKEPVVEIEGMNAEFSVGDGRATVSAQQGDYYLENEVLRVKGPMQVSRDNGDSLLVENAMINLDSKQLSSPRDAGPGDVKGRAGFGSYSAKGLFASLRERCLVLSGGVSGMTDFGSYSADRLTYDFSKDIVVLKGDARLRIDQGTAR